MRNPCIQINRDKHFNPCSLVLQDETQISLGVLTGFHSKVCSLSHIIFNKYHNDSFPVITCKGSEFLSTVVKLIFTGGHISPAVAFRALK